MLVDEYWERMGLVVPVYFATGLAHQATLYHKLFAQWTAQPTATSGATSKNPMALKHLQPLERARLDAPGPCVLFATPGMLHAGIALEAFRRWAGDARNLVLFPTFCIPGTLGHRLLNGAEAVTVQGPPGSRGESEQTLPVACQVRQLSFSAHADSKGILSLVRTVNPATVVLVHGERRKMVPLKAKIEGLFNVQCHLPQNGEALRLPAERVIRARISSSFLTADSPGASARAPGEGTNPEADGRTADGDDLGLHASEASSMGAAPSTAGVAADPPVSWQRPVRGMLLLQGEPHSAASQLLLVTEPEMATWGLEQHTISSRVVVRKKRPRQ